MFVGVWARDRRVFLNAKSVNIDLVHSEAYHVIRKINIT